MSGILIQGAQSKVKQLRTMIARATLAPTLVRLFVLVAAVGALLLAYPPVLFLQVLALLPAAFPRTRITTLFLTIVVLLWIVNSEVNPGDIVAWRLAALAILLYLVHVGAALAAVLPYDAVLTPGVFRPWILRALAVSGLTVAVAFFVTAVPDLVEGQRDLVGATIAGLVLMVTTGLFLAFLGNRRQ